MPPPSYKTPESGQSQLDPARSLYTGDDIQAADGDFVIGANVNNHANNVFGGRIDWIRWQEEADCPVVDDLPYL